MNEKKKRKLNKYCLVLLNSNISCFPKSKQIELICPHTTHTHTQTMTLCKVDVCVLVGLSQRRPKKKNRQIFFLFSIVLKIYKE